LVRFENGFRLGRVRLAIFDLDGTLIDSQQDLVNSVNAVREHLDLAPLDPALIASYVGNGAPVLIQRTLGEHATEHNVQRGLEYFLRYYWEHMLDHTRLYPGVQPALDALLASGVRMAVLTNKPVRFSQSIIDGLGLGGHFQRVYGGNSFPEKKPHPVGIETLLGEFSVDRAESIMVGDSSVDIRTARNAGIAACGVTFGFQPETFAGHPPDLVVDNLTELSDLIAAAL